MEAEKFTVFSKKIESYVLRNGIVMGYDLYCYVFEDSTCCYFGQGLPGHFFAFKIVV